MDRKIIAVALALCASSAHADLSPRDLDPNVPGYEGVYDSTRNVTWLRDAEANGLQDWDTQKAFVDGLTVGAFGGWRMAGGEISGLYNEWRTASSSIPGWFLHGGPGADVGFGSSLFLNAHDSVVYWLPDILRQPEDADSILLDRLTFEGLFGPKTAHDYVWAVHDGDIGVAVVPEPETYALLLVGLVGVVARRRHASTAPMVGVVRERISALMSFCNPT